MRAITPLTNPAGFIEVKPYEGYIDIGYTTNEQAEAAASVKVTFKNIPLPTTRTRDPSHPLLALQLSDLPTHLTRATLIDELKMGLQALDQIQQFILMSHLVSPT